MKFSGTAAILLGAALIAAITPLAQFITVSMTTTDMEVASPSGWALGLLTSLVLVFGLVRLVSRYRLVRREWLVILYCMLTIAVPMMNVGVVRSVFLAIRGVQRHFVDFSTNTYRTAYRAENPRWFPVVPTREGLAWNKADRLLSLLRDEPVLRKRESARRDLLLALGLEARRLAREARGAGAGEPADPVKLKALVDKLGANEAEAIADAVSNDAALCDAAARAGIAQALTEKLAREREASAAAARRLVTSLPEWDEHEVYLVPAVREKLERNAALRLEQDLKRLGPGVAALLQRKAQALAEALPGLRADVTALSNSDYAKVRSARAAAHTEEFAEMDAERLADIRTSFVYRSNGRERSALFSQDGQEGTPNQNQAGFDKGLFQNPQAAQAYAKATVRQKAAYVWERLPWALWRSPMAMWGALVLSIFLFLMCLAEWLRRKWVERENLAFPLVEIADNIIRHDYALESAEDVVSPAPRKRSFHPVFWVGLAVGVLILLLEALGNYRVTRETRFICFNVSKLVLGAGQFKEMDKVFFVLSPIVVGLLYLVSLEISRSVWVVFLIYSLVYWFGRHGDDPIKDPIYTGYAGGRNYPFPMEQMLGASICFAAILLFKAWHSRKPAAGRAGPEDGGGGSYIPARLNTVGLAVLPVVTIALLWDLGVTNLWFVLFIGLIALALAVAAARARAETGLPAQHVTYEFAKLPMVFGLTGLIGARVYTVFVAMAFLPVTLLFRLLPQQLENIELARRNRVRYGTVAAATLVAFVVAVAAGMVSFMVYAYYRGGPAFGSGTLQGQASESIMNYPMWVSHFLGEQGLDEFTDPHWIRIWFILLGFAVFGALSFLRTRVLNFPVHPLGYLLVLLSIYYEYASPYYKGVDNVVSNAAEGMSLNDTSWIWGGALIAWLTKKLVVKYGGMNTYKQTKPFFIGLVVGSVLCIFVVNMIDLVTSIHACRPDLKPGTFIKTFVDNPPYSPRLY